MTVERDPLINSQASCLQPAVAGGPPSNPRDARDVGGGKLVLLADGGRLVAAAAAVVDDTPRDVGGAVAGSRDLLLNKLSHWSTYFSLDQSETILTFL